MSESWFKLMIQPLIYFWCGAAARAQRFDTVSRPVFRGQFCARGNDLCLSQIYEFSLEHNLRRDAARPSRRLEFVGQKRKDKSKTQDLQTIVGPPNEIFFVRL